MVTLDETRVLLVDLVGKLNDAKSWSGETHIQKAAYFLLKLCDLELGFSFVLHKYGPYSFDLKNELLYLEAVGILDRKESPPFGSHFSPGDNAPLFKELVSGNTDKYFILIDWTIDRFYKNGPRVSELERKATALYALTSFSGSEDDKASRIHEIKPYISKDEALQAIQFVSNIIAEPGRPSAP